jgi:choline dehydrogenase-like flavoprotein
VSARATAWLSRGFEQLLHHLHHNARGEHDFDIVIVGSGYGGAIAAAELAGCTEQNKPITVCVLERGKEYLPGMFPSRLAELPGHIRFSNKESSKPRGQREGLFDVRVGPDVCALVANGLGGGSLINAGVMEAPDPRVFHDWPESIKNDLSGFLKAAQERLGARDNTIEGHANKTVAKYEALKRLDGKARPAAITVAMRDKDNSAGVARVACKLCGDCATGCNHDAKDSLDVNLLVEAKRGGAHIYTGATVLRIEREGAAWVLEVVHTDDKLRLRQGKNKLKLRTRRIILAAGTFGSTEILRRSASGALSFSHLLGHRFSANGDTIAVAYDQDGDVNAVGTESTALDSCDVGPTITGMIDLRSTNGLVIEELAIPGSLRRAFEEIVTTSNTLHQLPEFDGTEHHGAGPEHDPCAVDRRAIRRSSVLAVMGDDGAKGELRLTDRHDGDGGVCVHWPKLRDSPLFERQAQTLKERLRKTGGRLLPNPLWQLLPESMQFLFDNQRGPAFTVHPLGGCSMGKDAADGVVDHLGRVFNPSANASGSETWEGLVVLDGSIVRTALGINPGLTIAALALRAVALLRGEWGLNSAPQPVAGSWPPPGPRPVFSKAPHPEQPRETKVEVVERLSGCVKLAGTDGRLVPCKVELTLEYEPIALAPFVLRSERDPVPIERTLNVRKGRLRIFDEQKWIESTRRGDSDEQMDYVAWLSAPVTGSLAFLQREASTAATRRWRALRAWLLNRGLRDTWQWIADSWWLSRVVPGLGVLAALLLLGFLFGAVSLTCLLAAGFLLACAVFAAVWRRALNAFALASHAGEVRLFDYDLTAGTPLEGEPVAGLPPADEITQNLSIRGIKRFTYGRRSNPWRQLMQMELTRFLWTAFPAERPVLEIDTTYFGRKAVPLLHVVQQQDQPSALADMASFLAYFVRLFVTIHVWSFRKPDAASVRKPQRLPGHIDGLPAPQIQCVKTDDRLPDGTSAPVHIRLTRYKPRQAAGLPVLMIHGYSASGTTFAHPAVKPNLASHFCHKGRDVWIVDLRTSCGMPTARYPWTFEHAALADIPAAVDAICHETGSAQVDVVAHCMGAAMFSMAVLAPPGEGDIPYRRERVELPNRIHRAVLSQVGPSVVMSPANIFRGYIMTYMRYVLPLDDYQFRVPPDAGLANQMLDRFLATLPYPEEEFDLENPTRPCLRTSFVGSRHRMDALYGRVFSLRNVDPAVLECIDDLFGPLNIDTVAQAIHFARGNVITNPNGHNEYVRRENLKARWTFPTLSIHGAENGLADVATLVRNQALFRDANRDFRTLAFPGFGHQDCLIGRNAEEVFRKISNFLQ